MAKKLNRICNGISSSIVFWIFLCIVTTHSSLFSHGFQTVHFSTSLTNNPLNMRQIFGASDAGFYLEAAIQLDRFNAVNPDLYWMFNLWPPGLPILEATILRVISNDTFFGLVLGSVIATSWGIFLGYLTWVLHKARGFLVAILALLVSVSIGPLKYWILGHGMFFAESFSTLFFFVALTITISTLKLPNNDNLKTFVGGFSAGLFFSAAAYFRAPFYSLKYIMASLTILSIVIFIKRSMFFFIFGKPLMLQNIRKFFVFSLTCYMAIMALLNPWLDYKENKFNLAKNWSTSGQTFVAGIWSERESQADFLRDGGIGWACELDRIKCLEILKLNSNPATSLDTQQLIAEGIKVAVFNPIDYLQDRLIFFSRAWFSTEDAGIGTNVNLSAGILLLIGLFLFIYLNFINIKIFKLSIPLVFGGIFVVIAPNLIGHLEVRYLIVLKLLYLLLPLVDVNKKQHKGVDAA